jgi:transposase
MFYHVPMFIRKTRKLDRVTKKAYFVFQLVESIRTERGPRQRILLNLGSNLEFSQEELKALADRIEQIISGQTVLITPGAKIEALAQSSAVRLIKNLAQPAVEKETAALPDLVMVDLNSCVTQEARTIGSEDLLLRVACELNIPDKLKKLGFSPKETAIALGSIIGRAVFPASERRTHFRLIHQSGLGELLGIDFSKVSLKHFYQISDQLLHDKGALEEHIEASQRSVHRYGDTIALYDLTNTYFQGQMKANPKARFGVSKEKRSDCRLITLGLVINEHGFYKHSKFLSGNVSEPQTLIEAIKQLSKDDLFKPTIVLDAGIATNENLLWLRTNGYTYVVSARQKAPSIEFHGDAVLTGKSDSYQVKVAELPVHDGEKWLYCESPAKEATASAIKTRFQQRFETELKKLEAGLHKPRGRKKLPKVLERIGRLKEKHRGISSCYKIDVISSEDGQTARGLQWSVLSEKLSEKLTGHYYLRTNLIDRNAQELWDLYTTLLNIEEAFRFMKSSLGLRPVFHQKEGRVDGHLWITILAYTLIQDILYRLRSRGINYNWETIRTTLNSRVRVSMRAKTNASSVIHLRTTTEAEHLHMEIYNALGFSAEILKPQKTVV